MASKQAKRCSTSVVIRERLIEMRDIVLHRRRGRGWKCRISQVLAQRRQEPGPVWGSPLAACTKPARGRSVGILAPNQKTRTSLCSS